MLRQNKEKTAAIDRKTAMIKPEEKTPRSSVTATIRPKNKE